MTTNPPASRIRWHNEDGDSIVTITGCVGTLDPAVFFIYAPHLPGDEWVVACRLPGWQNFTSYGATPDEVKETAERWLCEFAAFLGVSFPDEDRVTVNKAALDRKSTRLNS